MLRCSLFRSSCFSALFAGGQLRLAKNSIALVLMIHATNACLRGLSIPLSSFHHTYLYDAGDLETAKLHVTLHITQARSEQHQRVDTLVKAARYCCRLVNTARTIPRRAPVDASSFKEITQGQKVNTRGYGRYSAFTSLPSNVGVAFGEGILRESRDAIDWLIFTMT